MKKLLFLTGLLLANFGNIQAQLSVTTGQTAAQYAQELIGTGVTISNAVFHGANSANGDYVLPGGGWACNLNYNCQIYQIGSFNNGNSTNLGITDGIMLTSGHAPSVMNPNTGGNSQYPNGDISSTVDVSDADLGALLGGGASLTSDCAILEFDFIPDGTSISFEYVFASAEYPGWVGSSFNDVFGFFLSGPGINGPYSNNAVNIALIPGTSTPVSINSVNGGTSCGATNGTNSQYFVDNCHRTTIPFRGFTVPLTASYDGLQCGETYRIKLAVGDIDDESWDSAVFLKRNSFSSDGEETEVAVATTDGETVSVNICDGESVTLESSITGALGGTYNWLPGGETTPNITVSPSTNTTYTVEYTYNLQDMGCGTDVEVTVTDQIEVIPSGAPNVEPSSNSPVCEGEAIELQVVGVGSYSWTGPNGFTSTDQNPIILNATSANNGAYTVTVESAEGCEASEVVNVIVIDKPTAPNISVDPPTCTEIGIASIVGYDNNNTYTFTPSVISVDGTGLIDALIGTYDVTVTIDGCTSSETPFTIEAQLPTPTAPVVDVTPADCDGDGTATISGYDSNLTYNFTTGTGTIEADGSITGVAGNYAITVTENGCTSTETSFTIEAQLPTPTAPVVDVTPADCDGDGTATINGYDSNLTYNFTTGTGTIEADGSITGVAGNYAITVTENGCTSSETSFTIEAQLPTPTAPVVDITPADCNGDGTATINGYDSNLTYNFTTGTGTIEADGSITGVAGNYAITVTENGCTSPETPFTIEAQLPTPAAPVVDVTPADCDGDGTATINGYDSNLTYNFTTGTGTIEADGSITGVAGNYAITVTENGCTSSETPFTIEAQLPTPAAPVVDVTPADCNGDGTATISGYDSNLTYNFTTGTGTIEADGSITGDAGNYAITATENGCTSPETPFTIEAQLPNPTISVNPINPSVCGDDGALELTFTNVPDGDYTITYNGGTFDVTVTGGTATINTVAGSYQNMVINNGQCDSDPVDASLSDPNAPTAPVVDITPADCDGDGTATINGYDSNLTYNFTTGTGTIEADGSITGVAGNYAITVTENGCTSPETPFTIEAQLPNPTISVNPINPSVCGDDGALELTFTNVPDGDYTITYNGGTFDVTVTGGTATINTVAGSYQNMVINNGQCDSDPVDASLSDPNAPTAPVVDITPADCNGDGTATINGYDSNLTYNLTTGTGTIGTDGSITGDAGNYAITVTENGCTSSETSFTIDAQLPTPTAPVVDITPADCNGDGTATISGYDSNLTYNFTTGTGTIGTDGSITGDAGNYAITVTENGCTSSETSFTIDAQLPTPTAPVVDVTPADCNGDGTATINGYDSNLTYNLTTGTGTIEADGSITGDAGNYAITVTENGCTSPETPFTIEAQLPTPAAPVVDVTPADCNGDGTATITNYNSTYTYYFSPANITLDNAGNISGEPGTYTVTAETGNCISDAATFVLEGNMPSPVVSINDTYSVCNGDNIIMSLINADEDLTYMWYFENELVNFGSSYEIPSAGTNLEGTYTIVATGSNGCTGSAETILNVIQCEVSVTEAFTPNGDGKNDVFFIQNIESYPNTKVWIYNRWGLEVYQSSDYVNNWDGTSMSSLNVGGDILPEGTYYYVIELGGNEDHPDYGKMLTGYVYLKR